MDCKLALNKLTEKNQVQLNWIPAHQGFRGNEVADRLAKRGASLQVAGPEPIIPVSEAMIRMELKICSKKVHQEKWRKRPDCRQTKMMIPTVYNNVWKQIRGLSRQKMKIATQMLTGHSTLQYHLWKMTLEDSALCEQCLEEEETVEHFLTECPAFSVLRHHTLGNMFLKQKDLPNLKISKILDFVDLTERLL